MVKIMQAHAVAAAQAADEEEERTFRNASGNSGDFSDDDSSSSESSSSDDDGHGSSDAGEGGAEFDAAMEGLGELDEEELAGMTDEQLLARLMPKQAAATSATKVKTAKLYGRKALLAAHDTAFKQSAVEKAVAVKEKARAEKKRKQRDESAAQETAPLPVFKNRQRVMLLCSRGITER